jgi:FkbM family methyltransferase
MNLLHRKSKERLGSCNGFIPVVFVIIASLVIQVFFVGLKGIRNPYKTKTEDFSYSSGGKETVVHTSLTYCNPPELSPELYRSQSGEDKNLLAMFGANKCGGTYVEMGALNGVKFSNSYLFHFGMNWKGVLIEASPTSFSELVKNRQNEIATVHAGVCNKEKDLHWVDRGGTRGDAVSGFLEFAPETFRKMWWNEQLIRDATVVKCRKLTHILQDAVGPGPYHFDFFSLDVEGAELEVLESLDFAEYSFGVIFVEADEHNTMKNLAVLALLEEKGYIFLQDKDRSYWFLNKKWHEIYSNITHT